MPTTLTRTFEMGIWGERGFSEVRLLREPANQRFLMNDFVRLGNSAGTAGTVGAFVVGVQPNVNTATVIGTATPVLGIALAPARSLAQAQVNNVFTAPDVPVAILRPGDQVVLPVSHPTASSARPGLATVNATYALEYSAQNVPHVNLANTHSVSAGLRYVGPVPGQESETYGLGIFTFLSVQLVENA